MISLAFGPETFLHYAAETHGAASSLTRSLCNCKTESRCDGYRSGTTDLGDRNEEQLLPDEGVRLRQHRRPLQQGAQQSQASLHFTSPEADRSIDTAGCAKAHSASIVFDPNTAGQCHSTQI
ncbi:hypothetical protein ACFX2I_030900 [Malus domestica]